MMLKTRSRTPYSRSRGALGFTWQARSLSPSVWRAFTTVPIKAHFLIDLDRTVSVGKFWRMKLAFISSQGRGGVAASDSALIRGLTKEKIDVQVLPAGNDLLTKLLRDASFVHSFHAFDRVLYSGSTPWISNLVPRAVKRALFVHGFVHGELVNSFKHGKASTRAGSIVDLARWQFFKLTDNIEFVATHSKSTYEILGMSTPVSQFSNSSLRRIW